MPKTNYYHILSQLPAVEAWETPPALEALARRLVASGRLRVNADQARNFVRHPGLGDDGAFSIRELTDTALLPQTKQRLSRYIAPVHGAQGVDDMLQLLRRELRKTRGISLEKELRIARVLVQSAHPSVIQLLLAASTQVFVSYSHNLGDLMDVARWQNDGLNSGLQATGEGGTAVYVSCGGDPFFEGEQKTYATDGFPALARMMVIAGQELGHFSDLLRQNGRIVGRYSTDAHHTQLRAAPAVATARRFDMGNVAALNSHFEKNGLPRLLSIENKVKFYSKRLRFTPPWLLAHLHRLMVLGLFRIRNNRANLPIPLVTYPRMWHGTALSMFLEDMDFNLAPEADVYRRPDPLEEEAIACIEALARVPQQVHKWGHDAVRRGWPQLYALYYGTVIPGCIAASPEPEVALTLPPAQRLLRFLRRRCRRRPDYYPER